MKLNVAQDDEQHNAALRRRNHKKHKRKILIYVKTAYFRGVQNRTNPIEKPQTEPTQTAKNRIWFGCIRIIFLLNRMVWFGLRFSFHQPNQTKPNRNITKTLIKSMSPRPILIETQWKLL